MNKLQKLREKYQEASAALRTAAKAMEDAEGAEALAAAEGEFEARAEDAQKAKDDLRRAERIAEARSEFPEPAEDDDDGERSGGSGARVGREALTYRPDASVSFLSDLYGARNGDSAARERLDRHAREATDHFVRKGRPDLVMDKRDITTGAGADGVIPPVYIAELMVDMPREGRPFVDVLPKLPLPPEGMTITVPRIVSGPSVDVQNPEGSAVSETDADTSQDTYPVRTIAGMQDMTIQAIERSSPAFDQLIISELVSVYDERVDLQALEGTGLNGQLTGIRAVGSINTVTYTDSTPTAAELITKLYNAVALVRKNRKRRASHIVMSPMRAAWLASALSSTFPIFQQGGYVQAVGAQNLGTVLMFAGLPVVEDGNISELRGASTNEDEIYVVHAASLPFMEGPLRIKAHDQPLADELKVRVVVHAYAAFPSARYPSAITKISGTGLTTPAF